MTGHEINAKLLELCEPLGGSEHVLQVVVPPKSVIRTPAPGGETCHCCICGAECWHCPKDIQHTVQQHKLRGHLLVCMDCTGRHVRATPADDHVVVANSKAGQTTGHGFAEIRRAEKQLAQALGIDYEDPLQNN